MNDIFDKKIVSEPIPQKGLHIDSEDTVVNKIAEGEQPNGIQSLSTISMERDRMYNQIDDMCGDSRMASILEAYAEDATCIGDNGKIVYCDSTDAKAAKMVQHILDAYDVDKYIYSWAHSLIKYGDVYIRMYHKSEMDDAPQEKDRTLNEAVKVDYFNGAIDKYSDFCQQVLNPAEMFELKKFGKTFAYIQCPLSSVKTRKNDLLLNYSIQYKDNDVKIYQPTSFVHGCLNQSSNRVAETIQIFGDDDTTADTYTVSRGQSLFWNTYNTWRTLQLLENALLLNRINSANILRIFQVDVTNLPSEEEIVKTITSVKNMLADKLSLNAGKFANLYLSEQPTLNYAVMPVKGNIGTLSMQEIGAPQGEDNLNDINYFKDKLYGALRAPKEYFGETGGDSAGFDAGGSIAQKSVRWGKAIKRIQNVLIQMLTDMVNLKLYDRGLSRYIDKFTIKMNFPVTQEDSIRQTFRKEQIDLVTRIMDSLDSVADNKTKLTILKYLLTTVIDDPDVLSEIQTEIDKTGEEESSKTEEQFDETETEEETTIEEEQPEEREPSGLNAEASAEI